MMKLTVAIPTYNPHPGRLERTLDALTLQDLSFDQWELLLVDNNSEKGKAPHSSLIAWHPNGRLIPEPKPGLSNARRCVSEQAATELIVFVDDDNLLDPQYLSKALAAFEAQPTLGAAGGICEPEFEKTPAHFVKNHHGILALRNLGDQPIIAKAGSQKSGYPKGAPVGAGMVIRRKILHDYYEDCKRHPWKMTLGRSGKALSSGEDNDIVLFVMEQGYDVAYLPELRLIHIIPEGRTDADYLARLCEASAANFIQVLGHHGISPWAPIPRWTLGLRKAKAWLTMRAWSSPQAKIRWRNACGIFEGRARLGERKS